MSSIINYCKNNKLITVFLNVFAFVLFLFCLLKRLTIDYFSLYGNDIVNIYFYSVGAICLFILTIFLLIFNIRIFKNKVVPSVFVSLILILTVLTVALCIYAKQIPVEEALYGDEANQKYSSIYPLDEIYSNKKYKDNYSFESVNLNNDYIVSSFQNRRIEEDSITDFNTDPKDTYLDFISFYACSDSSRIKEIKNRRKIVSQINGETDSEIIYNKNGFVVYDGEINYEIIYETENEFFYATVNRNKLNQINGKRFFEISKRVLDEYRLMTHRSETGDGYLSQNEKL